MPVVCGPFSGASPAWAKAEPTPAPSITLLSAKPVPALPKTVGPAGAEAIPAVLLVPVVHAPAAMMAPSYAGWLTDPPRAAPPGGGLIARGQQQTAVEVFQPVIAVAPPAPTSATAIPSSTIVVSVPLPPKRLAEKRMVVAALVPLPPRRLSEQVLVAAPPMALFAPPTEGAAALGNIPAGRGADTPEVETPEAVPPEADTPQVDAARPIEDGPEPAATRLTADRAPPHIETLIQRYAERFDVPARLVRRVAWRESKFNPRSRHGPYWGLMQIRVDTARGLGFRGAPSDLLDAATNMTYAVAYLANAYRVAGRDEKRAVMLYARGYYYEAKRKRMLDSLIRTADAEK